MYYNVLTTSRSAGISSGLTYASSQELSPGSHVKVPLRNAVIEGVVLAKNEKFRSDFDVKNIVDVIGDKPLLTAAQLTTLQWMSEKYCCSLRQALRVWLPSPPWDSLLPKEHVYYELLKPDADVRGVKQQFVIDYLRGKSPVPWDDIRSSADITTTTMRSLEEKGIVKKSVVTEASSNCSTSVSRPTLTSAQQEAYKTICASAKPTLLYGVTGSGKTEVYAQLIADAVEDGKQAILLLPEILLTEHFIHRFVDLLGEENICIIHSRLTDSQRRATWRKIHRGDCKLVIGSRSALFAPVENLGLVIIDEEHEWTYKNEQTPRYHARETAEQLCKNAGAKLVLGSATPSIESWAQAKNELYTFTELPNRYGDAELPEVTVVDMAEVEFGNCYPFSATLLDAIEDRLKKNEQSILFLNRRGMASALLCLDCKRRIVSPETNMPFTLHQTAHGQHLVDHTSGIVIEVPEKCPSCQSVRLQAVGAGTQKLESVVRANFPTARILRADKDTLDHPEKIRLLLEKMKNNEADILLGTQSVVKGLDLPNVTLAAVVLADVGMSLPHFRAGERVFQLLTQLTGRSGRSKPGEVIIQTYRPEAQEVVAAANHTTAEYLDNELKLRLYTKYPPATDMIRLICRGQASETTAKSIHRNLQSHLSEDESCTVSPTLFGGGNVWHVFIRSTNATELLSKVDTSEAVIDVDPIDCV